MTASDALISSVLSQLVIFELLSMDVDSQSPVAAIHTQMTNVIGLNESKYL